MGGAGGYGCGWLGGNEFVCLYGSGEGKMTKTCQMRLFFVG